MKKILFHTHQLNYRGTTNSMLDYALHNEKILGNKSTIIYNAAFDEQGLDIYTDDYVLEQIKKDFDVISYSSKEELEEIASEYDLFYTQKAGKKEEPLIESTMTANHAVFQFYEPHGDRYAFISEWLSNFVSKGVHGFVPYIVDLPKPDPEYRQELREKLGIPDNAVVFGRHGGFYTFDIKYVMDTVFKIVNKYDNIYFIFANTYKFYEHKQIKYIDPFFGGQDKSNYVSACDIMIHGRQLGESFGSSIADFLFHNKPVLAWCNGHDRNHILWLESYGLLYAEKTIEYKMIDQAVKYLNGDRTNYKKIVDPYTPELVMKKFEEVFIK